MMTVLRDRRHAARVSRRSRRPRRRGNRARRAMSPEFIGRLGHEMRTLPNIVLGFSQLLQTDGTSRSRLRAAPLSSRSARR